MRRRRVLASAGLTLVMGTAGCLDGDSDQADADGGSTDEETATPQEGNDEPPSDLVDGPLEPGETIVFFTDPGDAELEFTPYAPSLMSTLVITEESSRVMIRRAENGQFLIVALDVTNSGEESVDVPREVMVEYEGEQYRSRQNTQVGNEYDNLATLDPGESIERNLVFDVPDAIPPARLTATWEQRDLTGELLSTTAEWELSHTVEGPGERYDGLAPGESVEVRIGRTGYEVTTAQFDTTGEDVAVSLHVENTGPESVEHPLEHGVVLRSDGQSYERHPGDEDWPGETGALEEGDSREIAFTFEESPDADQIEVQLTPGAVAVWEP